jgi:hypothetical protein
MAFPSLPTAINTTATGTPTTVAASIGSPASGDTVLLFVAHRSGGSAPIDVPSGWVMLAEGGSASNRGAILTRACDGSEGATVTISCAVGGNWVTKAYVFTVGVSIDVASASETAVANPWPGVTLTPAGGAADYLWFAIATSNGTPGTSSYPSGYTDTSVTFSGIASTSQKLWCASKQATASSETPGDYTFTTTAAGFKATIAVALAATATLVTINNVAQSQSLGAATLAQAHAVAISGVDQAQQLDATTVTQAGVVAISGVDQLQLMDVVAIEQAHMLIISDVSQPLNVDGVIFASATSVAISDLLQVQAIDALALLQQHALVVHDVAQGQSVDNINLSGANTVTPHDISQALSIDLAQLTQAHAIAIHDLSQQQLIDIINFGAPVLGVLKGRLVVVSLLHGKAVVTDLLSGQIKIL